MLLRSALTLCSFSLLLPPLVAQQSAPVEPPLPGGIGTDPVDGKKPGTKRYNVTFRERSFTLDEFRTAIENGADAGVMERIVADLELRSRKDAEGFRKAIANRGGDIVQYFWLINACTIEIAPAQLEAVRDLPNVLLVDPDLPTHPAILTATNAANHATDAVQAAGNRGTGFGIATIDTGQDSNMGGTGRPHRTYFRNGSIAITNAGGLNGSLLLGNFQLGAQPADDTHGHGTGVCSVTSGSIWGGAGADNGHANDAFKIGYSICVTAGSCSSSLAVEAAGFQAAAADRVRFNIVSANMSYGSTSNMTDVSQQAIDSCALNANLLPVTAAGNGGTGATTGSSATANGLAVAAATNNTKAIAGFSQRGPMGTRTFPDIAANGVSTVMAGRDNDNGNYIASGTSMASPQVCGVAGLVKFARPNATAREIKAILLASSENVAGYTENTGGQGYLRTDRAIACASSADSVITSSIASTTAPVNFSLNVVSGQACKVALTWFRHNLASAVYSNLGLTVLNGAATVVTKDSAGNLYEVVSFTAPITGVLTVRVSASSLALTPQPFSIAASATTGAQPTFGGGVTGSFTISGGGCVGTGGLVTAGGIPSMYPSGNPRIGASLTLSLAFAKTNSAAILAIGASSLNVNLAGAGAPGCVFRSALDIILVSATNASGTGGVVLAIPNDPTLVNGVFHAQYLVFDAPANALDFVVSNSGIGRIGNR